LGRERERSPFPPSGRERKGSSKEWKLAVFLIFVLPFRRNPTSSNKKGFTTQSKETGK